VCIKARGRYVSLNLTGEFEYWTASVLSPVVMVCQLSFLLKGRVYVFYLWNALWGLNNFNVLFALYSFLLFSSHWQGVCKECDLSECTIQSIALT
jgi:hypothetical protein